MNEFCDYFFLREQFIIETFQSDFGKHLSTMSLVKVTIHLLTGKTH